MLSKRKKGKRKYVGGGVTQAEMNALRSKNSENALMEDVASEGLFLAADSAAPGSGKALRAVSGIGKSLETEEGLFKSNRDEAMANWLDPVGGTSRAIDDFKEGDYLSGVQALPLFASTSAGLNMLGIDTGLNRAKKNKELETSLSRDNDFDSGVFRGKAALASGITEGTGERSRFVAGGDINPILLEYGNRKKKAYLDGGDVYEAEGDETIIHTSNKPVVKNGGFLKKESPILSSIKGDKHYEGGVDMKGGDFIFSDKIKVPNTNNTFADVSKSYANNIEGLRELAELQESIKGEDKQANFKDGGIITIDNENQDTLDLLDSLSRKSNNLGVSPINTNDPVIKGTRKNNKDVNLQKGNSSFNNRIGFNDVLDKSLPYIDNAANFAINRKRAGMAIPTRGQVNPINLVEPNLDAEKAAMDDAFAAMSKGINTSSGGRPIGELLKQNAFANLLRAKSNLAGTEAKLKADVQGRETITNLGLEREAVNAKLADDLRKLGASDDLLRETSANAANLTEDVTTQSKDKKANNLVRDQQIFDIATHDELSSKQVKRNIEDLLGKEEAKKRYPYLYSSKAYGGKVHMRYGGRTRRMY